MIFFFNAQLLLRLTDTNNSYKNDYKTHILHAFNIYETAGRAQHDTRTLAPRLRSPERLNTRTERRRHAASNVLSGPLLLPYIIGVVCSVDFQITALLAGRLHVPRNDVYTAAVNETRSGTVGGRA